MEDNTNPFPNWDSVNKPPTTIRNFCFTYFLEDDEVWPWANGTCPWDRVFRGVAQEEVTTTGRRHIQGYINLSSPARFSMILKNLPKGIHICKAYGSARQNYEYCTKKRSQQPNGCKWEYGDWDDMAGQGRRTDLKVIANKIKEDKNLKRVAEEHPEAIVRYSKGLNVLNQMYNLNEQRRQSNWHDVDYRWYYGLSETGKSHNFWEEFKDKNVYVKDNNNKWWDGYDPLAHEVVLIDDYRDNKELPYQKLLNLCDIYPMSVEYKGGTIPFLAEQIVITSNFAPWEMWRDKESEDQSVKTPLMRRLTVKHFEKV